MPTFEKVSEKFLRTYANIKVLKLSRAISCRIMCICCLLYTSTVPNDIKNALTTDSSPVLTFTSAGVKGKYYSLPAKSYSIDFSWYAPFKSVGDTVVSCFMYLGFLVALWKRLPEIIHGSGVTFVGGVEFHENQLNDMTVSYTHLDVYKRQAFSRLLQTCRGWII